MSTHGIHHITAIAGNPQRNIDFYVGTLGLRLVKKTVNFDDPHRYHFYYGDGVGRPGTILTFFAWDSNAPKGRRGSGQVTTISFSVPEKSLEAWTRRLEQKGVHVDGPFARFDEEFVRFRDPDGLELELVAAGDSRPGWASELAPPAEAVRGLHSLSLSVEEGEGTGRLMTGMLGFRKVAEEAERFRYEAGEGGPGNTVDVLRRSGGLSGRPGVGTNHHVAWRVIDGNAQVELRGRLLESGCHVSEVMDRTYFRSIYFNEPGGVLFEVATDPPGFDIDEDLQHLGSSLKLPPQLEPRRDEIERVLPSVVVPGRGV